MTGWPVERQQAAAGYHTDPARLRIVALILMAHPVVSMWSQIAEAEMVLRALPKDLAIASFEFSYMGIAMGILVLVVAEVFSMGVRLREDVEGLV